MSSRIDPSFTVVLRNIYFGIEHVFDSVFGLNYSREINQVGFFEFMLNGNDPWIEYFTTDCIIEIRRGIIGINLQKYTEFTGLVRSLHIEVQEDGMELVKIAGVGLNHLLQRTIINYVEGTIKSYKYAPAETAMKEYAWENCGSAAITDPGYEREYYGVLPNFEIDTDTGAGVEWEGDRAFANLLDVLQDIANFSGIDFEVIWDSTAKEFVFTTYPNKIGTDRSVIGLDVETGLNAAGYAPIIFSLERGNIKTISYDYDRAGEANVISVLGDGDGATRKIIVRTAVTQYDSPWNRCEASRGQGGFEHEMEVAGDEQLKELAAKEIIEFKPLIQASYMYGKHFFLGDKITIQFRGKTYHRRITKISNSVSDKEDISLTFEE